MLRHYLVNIIYGDITFIIIVILLSLPCDTQRK